jgi:hypothetical protein
MYRSEGSYKNDLITSSKMYAALSGQPSPLFPRYFRRQSSPAGITPISRRQPFTCIFNEKQFPDAMHICLAHLHITRLPIFFRCLTVIFLDGK